MEHLFGVVFFHIPEGVDDVCWVQFRGSPLREILFSNKLKTFGPQEAGAVNTAEGKSTKQED